MGDDRRLTAAGRTSSEPRQAVPSRPKTSELQLSLKCRLATATVSCDGYVSKKSGSRQNLAQIGAFSCAAVTNKRAVTSNRRSIPSFISPQQRAVDTKGKVVCWDLHQGTIWSPLRRHMVTRKHLLIILGQLRNHLVTTLILLWILP